MALSEVALAGVLKGIYAQMQDGTKDDNWYADELAKAITDQIKTAEIPAGTVVIQVTGQAVGTPNPAPINVQ